MTENIYKKRIGIIGLGYVGLPLAVSFGRKFSTLGFDINQQRIEELNRGEDHTLEVSPEELKSVTSLTFSSEPEDLSQCDFIIVTVPTPIDKNRQPDLTPLKKASEMIGKVVKSGATIIYESTVYPGATEEVCIPLIEKYSGLKFNQDFYAGYSPERINPGDKTHRLESIIKVTSGSTPEIGDLVDQLYLSIIEAGTHRASSIKVAEAAKVIENTQRDLNIALINELAMIFERLGIDTEEVLLAAGSKWNFLPFRPGLVGGHCIGVDPYYLTHKAEEIGYHPEVILAGRRINDQMGEYVVSRLVKKMLNKKIMVNGANVLLMGITFKENCPDIRNTKVVDIATELDNYHVNVDIYDPWAESEEVQAEYGLKLVSEPEVGKYDAIIAAVAHQEFKQMSSQELRALGKDNCVVFDLKYIIDKEIVDLRL
ncbi:Vi polysaccharide biosynthesis UDP-N-acetylglucosamine C-6 dehydrogenase TviB [Aliiglaciecola sp. 2_MG-2023]|uniref:Vi polysaccharide biosynthesis UDP-N-acetylglucosamine C-6 dehydrogenase TviB n=1 Tax=unclassified Aliiglaciecola TaxID=2593648 RepID=UPI0026E37F4C|nr:MULTISPECIES: Vi polysaccharide biosynthesis UDP-N-acetylglucosamine C-6 dehydrogenase TviB [unclassified Aliiglaciecola]MDO6709985.1 Vi polysaccharide biosynthesis UDP-N-acetylglucosamine C-6 dehydrogenase TviB [Aliiglaciecola sp. 2_MG-2023]MDO6751133.1 Vi polysaccharide biosynthesis UDP-N-acetylglucosamine C-6 dehydrogenase TviB [Aliiglaciecola sp. 1_MG-2023]